MEKKVKKPRYGTSLFLSAVCVILIGVGTTSCFRSGPKSDVQSNAQGQSAIEGNGAEAQASGGDADIFAGRFLNGRPLFAKDSGYECRDNNYSWRPGYRSAIFLKEDGTHEVQEDACANKFSSGLGVLDRSKIDREVIAVEGVRSISNLTFEKAEGLKIHADRAFIAEQPYIEAWCQRDVRAPFVGDVYGPPPFREELYVEIEGPAMATGKLYSLAQFSETDPVVRTGPVTASRSMEGGQLHYVGEEASPDGSPALETDARITLAPDDFGRYPAFVTFRSGRKSKSSIMVCIVHSSSSR